MTKDEMKLKAKVDEYFEKYMCVSFDKFIENWEELERYFKEQDEILQKKGKEIERLNTNIEVLNGDLWNIAQLLDLEEGGCVEDILDKIKELKGSNNNE